jgi:hypothetical protein
MATTQMSGSFLTRIQRPPKTCGQHCQKIAPRRALIQRMAGSFHIATAGLSRSYAIHLGGS